MIRTMIIIALHLLFSIVPFTEGLICACDGPDHNCYNGMCTSIASVCYTQFEVYPNSSFNITSHYCPSGPLGHCDITQNNSGVLTHRTCCSDNLCNICPDISKLSEFKAYYNLAVDSNCSSPTPPASPVTDSTATTVSNSNSYFISPSTSPTAEKPLISLHVYWITGVIVLAAAVHVFIIVACTVYCVRNYNKHHMVSPRSGSVESPKNLCQNEVTNSISESLLRSNTNQMILSERTIGDDLVTIRQLGRGSFGTVYLATYHGDEIAVKSFHPSKMQFFQREEDIYNTCMLNNNHILRFIASDSHFRGNVSTEPILLFEYIPNGNLTENLRRGLLNTDVVLKLCLSLLSGLQFLHHEMLTVGKRKPGIAHRDLKSPNILVREDFTCCIADLGLAVKENGYGGVDRVPPNIEGTRRYLPPEVLTTNKQPDKFSFYRAGDIYSVSLILWEIVNSSPPNGQSSNYSIPFEGLITGKTTEEEVRHLIVNKNERPAFKPELLQHKILGQLVTIIREGWDTDPARRPSSLNIKKRIAKLRLTLVEQ